MVISRVKILVHFIEWVLAGVKDLKKNLKKDLKKTSKNIKKDLKRT